MAPNQATVIIASPEKDSNLYYACRFLAPDPILYFEIRGRKSLILPDLELDRGKKQARVHNVLSLTDLQKTHTKNQKKKHLPLYARIVDSLLRQNRIKHILVPSSFPSLYYSAFLQLGYKIHVKKAPFYEKRLIKSQKEKKYIRQTIIQVERALKEALLILQRSRIKRNKIYYGKELVTSELLRSVINSRLIENECVPTNTIVASGIQASFPHLIGSGPIVPHMPIIFDIFPRHAKTLYYADMSRTVVKGKSSPEAKRMYRAVLKATRLASQMVAAGINSAKIHRVAKQSLEKSGFKTGKINGRRQGFIHSTGHGLGLDVHELPSISSRGSILRKGNIITIEPGLYYEKYGGVRIEDDLYVTRGGSEKLTKFPNIFELDKA